jgi:predicted RNase H-like nuclease (RuvC/YqgF family)
MAKAVALVHPDTTLQVPGKLLVSKCDLFLDDPGLAAFPYHLKSHVSLSDFREFVSGLEGTTVKVTNSNVNGLWQLCQEFRFQELAGQVSHIRESGDFGAITALLSALQERMQQRDEEIGALQTELSQQLRVQESLEQRIRTEAESANRRANEVDKHVAEVRSDVEPLRTALMKVTAFAEGTQKKSESTAAHLGRVMQLEAAVSTLRTATVDGIRSEVEPLRTALMKVTALAEGTQKKAESTAAHLGRVVQLETEVSTLRTAIVDGIRSEVEPLRTPLTEVRELAEPSGWNPAIVRDFPKLFEDFKKKQFTLLWRGSRDGFGAGDFHLRCDGHSNTLTVILDTGGNIFGGFTPVEWKPRTEWPYNKTDPSLKSFLFTLKNPHNIPARRFALKAERKDRVIYCHSGRGANSTPYKTFWC